MKMQYKDLKYHQLYQCEARRGLVRFPCFVETNASVYLIRKNLCGGFLNLRGDISELYIYIYIIILMLKFKSPENARKMLLSGARMTAVPGVAQGAKKMSML